LSPDAKKHENTVKTSRKGNRIDAKSQEFYIRAQDTFFWQDEQD
jgi:hypothetical protein